MDDDMNTAQEHELLQWAEDLEESSYYALTMQVQEHVVGRTIANTEAGTSGFVLYFDDGTWALCHLEDEQWNWKVGRGAPSFDKTRLLNSPFYGDASGPLNANVPYANEPCDFSAEVAKARGWTIACLVCGEKCFNFCFGDGRELNVDLRLDNDGRLAYRVFWEQS